MRNIEIRFSKKFGTVNFSTNTIYIIQSFSWNHWTFFLLYKITVMCFLLQKNNWTLRLLYSTHTKLFLHLLTARGLAHVLLRFIVFVELLGRTLLFCFTFLVFLVCRVRLPLAPIITILNSWICEELRLIITDEYIVLCQTISRSFYI